MLMPAWRVLLVEPQVRRHGAQPARQRNVVKPLALDGKLAAMRCEASKFDKISILWDNGGGVGAVVHLLFMSYHMIGR